MTSNLPEPSHGQLRAADADRNLVADLLTAAYAEGRLTRPELDDRLTATMAAKTFDDLTPLTADLVPTGGVGRSIGAVSSPGSPLVDRQHASNEVDTTVAIFAGTERRGAWRARRRISNITLFGGTVFDLRSATFEADTIDISTICLFGGVEVIVPEGVGVRNETVAIFGGTDLHHLAPPQPGAPTVVLKGLVLFGGMDAHGDKKRNKRH